MSSTRAPSDISHFDSDHFVASQFPIMYVLVSMAVWSLGPIALLHYTCGSVNRCSTIVHSCRFDFARPDRQCLESLVKAPSRIILFIGTCAGDSFHINFLMLNFFQAIPCQLQHCYVSTVTLISCSDNLIAVALLIFLALMVTLSVIAVDERIALYPFQPTLW